MEEKQLNAEQSIELISRMIDNTRRQLERNSGRPFLIWGYTTVALSLFNYWFRVSGYHPAWSMTWFALPMIGLLLMRLFPAKKDTEPRTEIDRIVAAVWKAASLAIIPIFIIFLFQASFQATGFAWITLTMAIATTATGTIVRSRIYTAAGLTGMAASTIFAVYGWFIRWHSLSEPNLIKNVEPSNMLIFAAIFVVMMIIPGHISLYKSRHPEK